LGIVFLAFERTRRETGDVQRSFQEYPHAHSHAKRVEDPRKRVFPGNPGAAARGSGSLLSRGRADKIILAGATPGYDCGFHSRARFCASASWSDDISPATVSRFLTAAVRLRVSLAGKRAAARLYHICDSTAFCVTPSPRPW